MGVKIKLENVFPMRQARYWICTIPEPDWEPVLPDTACHVQGQLEQGERTGYRHWQCVVSFTQKKSLAQVRSCLPGTGFYEPTRSDAARAYVWKEETRIGEPFEFGRLSVRRNNQTDWDSVLSAAKRGEFSEIPSDILVRYYGSLCRISADFAVPTAIERSCKVYWGDTGVGKSRRAWAEAGVSAYCKDPRSKFWCGYRGETDVVIDEFRGGIDVAHLLRWLDRYPVRVEIKGGSRILAAQRFWITSNIPPEQWYPDLDAATVSALLRRLEVRRLVQPFS